MAYQYKYSHSTKGFNAEVVVAKALAYTTQATYVLFVANAAEGEIGIYDAKTGALYNTATPVPTGTSIFIAQKRDAQINKTTPFTYTPGVTGTRNPYIAPVKDVWTISGFPTFAAGQVYSINVIETTSGNQPNHVWNFDTTAKASDANGVQDVVDRLVLQINDTTNPVNYAFGQAMVASRGGTGATSTLILTANDFGRSFRIALREDTATATQTHTTQAILGVGIAQNVQEVEAEGFIFAGTTTNYPGGWAIPSEFGIPTSFVDLTLGYNTYIFSYSESEDSPTPVERHWKRKYTVLFVPSTGTTPEAAVKAALAL